MQNQQQVGQCRACMNLPTGPGDSPEDSVFASEKTLPHRGCLHLLLCHSCSCSLSADVALCIIEKTEATRNSHTFASFFCQIQGPLSDLPSGHRGRETLLLLSTWALSQPFPSTLLLPLVLLASGVLSPLYWITPRASACTLVQPFSSMNVLVLLVMTSVILNNIYASSFSFYFCSLESRY